MFYDFFVVVVFFMTFLINDMYNYYELYNSRQSCMLYRRLEMFNLNVIRKYDKLN